MRSANNIDVVDQAPETLTEQPALSGHGQLPRVQNDTRLEGGNHPQADALKRLALFFAMVLILIVGMDQLITFGLHRLNTGTFGGWNRIMAGAVNASVVISGSSRAAYHYDPRIITAVTSHTAFNLGKNGSQTDVQLAVLRAYLAHNRKPDVVIHNLDAFTFVTTKEVYDPAQYVPYLRDPQLYAGIRQIEPEFRKSRYLPLYGYAVQDMNFTWILGFRGLLGLPPHDDSYSGFTPQGRQWTGDFGNYRAANPHGVNFAVDPHGIAILDQLMQLCKENGIPLIMIYSPEYTEMQSLEHNRAQIFGEFKRLGAKYDVPLWDYSDWIYADKTEYFYNSQHLNARGAAIFSNDVADRLQGYFAVRSDSRPEPQASSSTAQ